MGDARFGGAGGKGEREIFANALVGGDFAFGSQRKMRVCCKRSFGISV
jgi:hypothetical protein